MQLRQELQTILSTPGYSRTPVLPLQLYYRLTTARHKIRLAFRPSEWRAAVQGLSENLRCRIITNRQILNSAGGSTNWQDLQNYGFDFLLVVESAALAESLYRNDFPFKFKGAVLAVDGRPTGLKEYYLDAVKRFQLPVFLFHNPERRPGLLRRRITADLAGRQIGPAYGNPIIDLGLWPDDIIRLRRYISGPRLRPARGRPKIRGLPRMQLRPWELPMLRAGLDVHWAAFYPDTLTDLIGRGAQKELRRMYRAFEENLLAAGTSTFGERSS